jgi:hypothetical protein
VACAVDRATCGETRRRHDARLGGAAGAIETAAARVLAFGGVAYDRLDAVVAKIPGIRSLATAWALIAHRPA